MESKERHRLDRLDEERTAREKREDRIAYASTVPLLKIGPILKKSKSPCHKNKCLGCHNYDPDRIVGYTCLIKGTSRQDPTEAKVCCYFIAKGQTSLGTVGAP